MDSLTDDLWTMVLARLPIKIFTGFKLVCKQWKSILESQFFRNLFMSLHQNSASTSCSLMSTDHLVPKTVNCVYQCDIWGLKRPLSSFIKSVLDDKNPNNKYAQVSVVAYSDVGLILIYAVSVINEKTSLYVANPVSHECVEIFLFPLFDRSELCYTQWGIATRVENGILLGYKVVVFFNQSWGGPMLLCMIYSSETGLWNLDDTSFFNYYYSQHPISLNGNLHWFVINDDNQEVVLSMDLYTNSTGSSYRCRVSPFPDLEKTIKFSRACTPCHGFLMYMNIVSTTKVDGSLEDKLCVWKLQSEGWQLISEISPGSILTDGFDYTLIMINPFDAKTAYFWCKKQEKLIFINLHNGKSVIYNQFELTSDGRTMIPAHNPRVFISFKRTYIGLVLFVLPQWLYRIPNTVRIV